MPRTYPVPPHAKETWGQLQEIIKFGYPASQVFSDFLDTVLNTLLSFTYNFEQCGFEELQERMNNNALQGPYEQRYLSIVRKYKENATKPPGQRPADFFANAWGALQIETEASNQDVIGAIYETQITLGEHGQFMTPDPITQLITDILAANDGEKVLEPAVGSGRFLIQAGKQNPHRRLFGIDKNSDCAKMCVLNMHLFNLSADIYLGNTLSMEMSRMWMTRRPFGWVWEKDLQEATNDQERSQDTQEKPTDRKTEDVTPPSIEVVRGVRRIDNYQSPETDPLFTVAFVFEREDLDDSIDQLFSSYPHQRTTIADSFSAIITSANVAPEVEEMIKKFISQREKGEPATQQKGSHTTRSAKRRAKKHMAKHGAKPVQQSLFGMED